MILQAKGLKVWRDDAYCPDWYASIQAAKYLGVAPWDLIEKEQVWSDWAFSAMTIEEQVRKILEK